MRDACGLSFKVLERRSGRIVTFWRDEEACLGGHGHDEDDVVMLTTTDNDDDGDDDDDGIGIYVLRYCFTSTMPFSDDATGSRVM